MRLLEFGFRVCNDEGLWQANVGSEIGFKGSGFNERFGLGRIKYPGSSCQGRINRSYRLQRYSREFVEGYHQ